MTRSATDICGVGSPAILFLEQYGGIVWDAFGHPPFLCGSAARGKTWRDVDVRLMLPDEEFLVLFGKPAPLHSWTCGKWGALCMAFSVLGERMTGLPIDFQIQDTTYANKAWPDGPRQTIGLLESRRCERPHAEVSPTGGDVMAHTCHATGCETRVAPAIFMCKPHWFSLPKPMRDAIWRTYRAGQCADWQISHEYAEAAKVAVTFVAQKEGKVPDLGVYKMLDPGEPKP